MFKYATLPDNHGCSDKEINNPDFYACKSLVNHLTTPFLTMSIQFEAVTQTTSIVLQCALLETLIFVRSVVGG